jgi:hypothetical protein
MPAGTSTGANFFDPLDAGLEYGSKPRETENSAEGGRIH